MDPLSALLGGGLSAIGSIFGSDINAKAQTQIAQQNIQEQMLYAQNGLSWRVQDAKNAGINPLAALGFQGPTYQNVVGATNPGAGIAAAGQDIARAMGAMQSPEMRQAAVAKTSLDLEGQKLDNDLKRTQMAIAWRKYTQPGQPPGMPPLMTAYKDRDGNTVWLPSKDAAVGYQAKGLAGALEATVRGGANSSLQSGSTNPYRRPNWAGFMAPYDLFGLRK